MHQLNNRSTKQGVRDYSPVAVRGAEVPRLHVDLEEQWGLGIGLVFAELGHPLHGLPVLHPRVVEPCRDEQRGVCLLHHVLHGAAAPQDRATWAEQDKKMGVTSCAEGELMVHETTPTRSTRGDEETPFVLTTCRTACRQRTWPRWGCPTPPTPPRSEEWSSRTSLSSHRRKGRPPPSDLQRMNQQGAQSVTPFDTFKRLSAYPLHKLNAEFTRTATLNRSGRLLSTAPMRSPPADRPSVDVSDGTDQPCARAAKPQKQKQTKTNKKQTKTVM